MSERAYIPEPGGASTAGALTHVHTLADVHVPEDLPPDVAKELADLVATRKNTVGRWLRDSATWWVLASAAALGGVFFHEAAYALAVVFGLSAFGSPWRKQLYRVLEDRMREFGLNRPVRDIIHDRIERLVGAFPRHDPVERPSAARLLALLAPQRDRLGVEVAAPVLSPIERERDDLRLAALGYLRYSRTSAWLGWLFSALFIVVGGLVTQIEPAFWTGVVLSAFGLLTGISASFRSLGDMRRAIPHADLSMPAAWRLWRRVRGAAKGLDKKLPDTARASAIALALTSSEESST